MDQSGAFRLLSPLEDLKYTCSVHHFYLKIEIGGLLCLMVKRGFLHCSDQLAPYSFIAISTGQRLVAFYYQVYVSFTSSCQFEAGQSSVFSYFILICFLQGVRPRTNPLSGSFRWSSKLAGVLFEQIEQNSFKVLSVKTAFPLALTSAKRVSNFYTSPPSVRQQLLGSF